MRRPLPAAVMFLALGAASAGGTDGFSEAGGPLRELVGNQTRTMPGVPVEGSFGPLIRCWDALMALYGMGYNDLAPGHLYVGVRRGPLRGFYVLSHSGAAYFSIPPDLRGLPLRFKFPGGPDSLPAPFPGLAGRIYVIHDPLHPEGGSLTASGGAWHNAVLTLPGSNSMDGADAAARGARRVLNVLGGIHDGYTASLKNCAASPGTCVMRPDCAPAKKALQACLDAPSAGDATLGGMARTQLAQFPAQCPE